MVRLPLEGKVISLAQPAPQSFPPTDYCKAPYDCVIMEAAKESSSLEKALSSLLNQVSVGDSKTKSVSTTKMQPRMKEKKFTNRFLGDVFRPFTHEP